MPRRRSFLAIAPSLVALLGPTFLAGAIEETPPLILLSAVSCTVSVDGRRVAELEPDEPLRLELADGEYVLSAVATDGRRWSKVLRLQGSKSIVRIEFAGAAPAPSGAPAPASAPRDARATGEAAVPPPVWKPIPAGEFEMGCSPGDSECQQTELPRRLVSVSPSFELMDKPVTVRQFRDWATSSGRRLPPQPKWSDDDTPIVNVTWDDAAALCSAWSARLPTEREWEYAARANSRGSRYGELDAIAWYAGNSEKRAHAVGGKSPNAFGLYDMLGNVWEWTADRFQQTLATADDSAPVASSELRSLRGGSWRNKARQIRVSNRGRLAPDDREDDDGFRCARDVAH